MHCHEIRIEGISKCDIVQVGVSAYEFAGELWQCMRFKVAVAVPLACSGSAMQVKVPVLVHQLGVEVSAHMLAQELW